MKTKQKEKKKMHNTGERMDGSEVEHGGVRLGLCVHSSAARRPERGSHCLSLRLSQQREIDLECERGEVKVLYNEERVG